VGKKTRWGGKKENKYIGGKRNVGRQENNWISYGAFVRGLGFYIHFKGEGGFMFRSGREVTFKRERGRYGKKKKGRGGGGKLWASNIPKEVKNTQDNFQKKRRNNEKEGSILNPKKKGRCKEKREKRK